MNFISELHLLSNATATKYVIAGPKTEGGQGLAETPAHRSCRFILHGISKHPLTQNAFNRLQPLKDRTLEDAVPQVYL